MRKFKITFSFLVFIIFVFLIGSYAFWNSLLKPVGGTGEETEFIIERGERVSSIADRLERTGFIKNSFAFQILLKVSGVGSRIQAGRFYLSANMEAKEIASKLTHGVLEQKITVIEGWRVEEIASYLEATTGGKIRGSEFLKFAKEGYMFPDTYQISENSGASEVAKLMLDNFNKKVDSEILKGFKNKGITLEQGVIFASIIEREAKYPSDRPIIAGILLKRFSNGQALETDATVQYALGFQKSKSGGTWWKKDLTVDDLAIDSVYNTRKFAGLPPGPIASPGLEVIRAVANPMETQYWFYVSDKNGKMHYGITLEEHNENVLRYIGR